MPTPSRRSTARPSSSPPRKSSSVALTNAPIVTSVSTGCSAWPSQVPLRASFTWPLGIAPRTVFPIHLPTPSRALSDSNRLASGWNGDGEDVTVRRLHVALPRPRPLLPPSRVELDLAKPQLVRGHLDGFVGPDELERLVERELMVRHETHGVLRAGGAHVRLLLLAHGVHVEVVGARVLAHDHALVDLLSGPHEQLPALLELEQCELPGVAAAIGDEAAGGTRLDVAVPGLVALEDGVEDPRAARLGQELGAEPDQPARVHQVLDSAPAGPVVDHLLHAPLPQREQLRRDAEEVLRDVDREALDRLVQPPVQLTRDNARLADRQLESLAPHRLHQHRQLELAAPLHLPRVRSVCVEDADRGVAHQLLLEPLAHEPGGELAARAAGERRGVDAHGHADRGLVDRDERQRAR